MYQQQDELQAISRTHRNNNSSTKTKGKSTIAQKLKIVVFLCICYLLYQTFLTFKNYSNNNNRKIEQNSKQNHPSNKQINSNKQQLKIIQIQKIEQQEKFKANQYVSKNLYLFDNLESLELSEQNTKKLDQNIKDPSIYIVKTMKNIVKHQQMSQKFNQYYSQIQKQITVLVINCTTASKQNKDGQTKQMAWLINGLHEQNRLNAQQCCQDELTKIQQLCSFQQFDNNSHNAKIVYLLPIAYSRSKIVEQKMISRLQKYEKYVSAHVVDGFYRYILSHMEDTNTLLFYLDDRLVVQGINLKQLLNQQTNQFQVQAFCPHTIDTHASSMNMVKYQQSMVSECMHIFSSSYLQQITPTNYIYQNIYTILDMLIVPVLSLSQMSNQLTITIHNFTASSRKSRLINFELTNLNDDINLHERRSADYMCFIAFPTLIYQNNYTQVQRYLKQLEQTHNSQYPIVVIISLIYVPQPSITDKQHFSNIIQNIQKIQYGLKDINIRIRLRQNQVKGPLQVYQSIFQHCPENSIIISSRMNINPIIENIVKQSKQSKLCKNSNPKYVMLGNYLALDHSQATGQTNLARLITISSDKSRKQYDHYFDTHLAHGQIFCANAFRHSFLLEHIKWRELEFYQTQYSYSIPIIEIYKTNYYFASTPLFQQIQKRQITRKQKDQIQGLQLRKKFHQYGKNSNLDSIKFTGLNNVALSFPKQKTLCVIPSILHQIWLSDSDKISDLKSHLSQTLQDKNPKFAYKLWQLSDIRLENFPYTYGSIRKIEKMGEKIGKNYRALMADLMRIQILYWFGGVYLDMKIEGRKGIEPFLKYEQFFYYSSPSSMVNGLIGSIKGNRAFKNILVSYFNQQAVGKPSQHIYDKTGGPVIAKAYSQKQSYVRVLNFIQFIGQGQRPCIFDNFGKQPDSDQKVYTGITAKGQAYRIFVPCKKNKDKYLQLYNVLGRTYLPGASNYS